MRDAKRRQEADEVLLDGSGKMVNSGEDICWNDDTTSRLS